MSAPAPEQPAPVAEGVGALLVAFLRLRAQMLEAVAQRILTTLALLRGGAIDQADAYAEVAGAVTDMLEQAQSMTEAYLEQVFGLYDETLTPRPRPPLPDLVLDGAWEDLVERVAPIAPERPSPTDPTPDVPVLPDLPADPSSSEMDEFMSALMDDIDRALEEAAAEAEAEAMAEASETIIGYRRIIHPELAKGGTCGLCVAAATRIYTRANLKPLHDNCGCEVLPVTEANDPGADLNASDLAAVYEAGGTTDGRTLKQARFTAGSGGLEAVKERGKKGAREPRDPDEKKPTRNPASEGLADMSTADLRDHVAILERNQEIRYGGSTSSKDGAWTRRRLRFARAELARRS